ncbi:MAG: hypothetical protein U0R80_11495 [Nocardioidaceae bacterium]
MAGTDRLGDAVFGRLPRLYRWRTIAAVLVVSMVAGAWFAHETHLPVVTPLGVVMGGLVGVLLAHLVVHQVASAPRLVRVRHRR